MSWKSKARLFVAACVVAGGVTVGLHGAVAQQQPGGQPAGQAAGQTDNVAVILQQITNTAEELKKNLDELPELIERARNSRQEGEQLLDRLENLVREVADRVAEDSELWKQIDELQRQWEENRARAADRAQTDSRYVQIAELWQEKIDQLSELKREIIARRGESLSLLDQLMAQRDVIIEYYELGQAELVVAALQDISSQFAAMNEGMAKVVEIATTLGPAEQ